MKSVPLHERPICSYIPHLTSSCGRTHPSIALWPSVRVSGASEGNRNPISDLEGQHSTIKLHPHMARPKGFEPPISRFVAAHSIQLSYRRISCPAKSEGCCTFLTRRVREAICSMPVGGEIRI